MQAIQVGRSPPFVSDGGQGLWFNGFRICVVTKSNLVIMLYPMYTATKQARLRLDDRKWLLNTKNWRHKALMFEASSAYERCTAAKATFDHYKAMFGMLGVLRNTASRYCHASFDTFRKLKIHFVHAHGKNNAGLIVATRHLWLSFSFLRIILGSEIR